MLNERNTLAEWVVARPGLTRMFERLGLDYCCGGKQSLEAACTQKGLDAKSVVQTIFALESAGGAQDVDWSKAGLTELADHIESTHHKYLKEEMPRLATLVSKVASVHGPNHPELQELRQVYAGLQEELTNHLHKEEVILFPAIRELEAAGGGNVHFPFGTMANPIRMMIMEHESAGESLEEIRRLTGDYSVPGDACRSYQAMIDGLKEMEQDLHQHIHKENNILFPRAVEMEAAVRQG